MTESVPSAAISTVHWLRQALGQSPFDKPLPLTSEHKFDVPDWTIARVTGQNVRDFLQGQVTCHMQHLSERCALWGAHCNVKGRALANFLIAASGIDTFILTPSNTFELLQSSLKKYGLFNQIAITREDARLTAAISPQPQLASQGRMAEPSVQGRFPAQKLANGLKISLSDQLQLKCTWQPGDKSYPKTKSFAHAPPLDSVLWHIGLIHARLGFITAATAEAFIPIELNMDIRGGIAFDKGCYIGQEIIARLHYRGEAKQRLCGLTLPPDCPLLAPGTALFQDDDPSPCGTIIQSAQADSGEGAALAVLRLKKLNPDGTISMSGIHKPSESQITLPSKYSLVVAIDPFLAAPL